MMQGEQLQTLVEATRDRIVGVPGLSNNSLIPLEEPGIEAIMLRDIQRSVVSIESLTKLALYPRRKTDLPKTPREAYEDKDKYTPLGVFPDSESMMYPRWEHLTAKQKEIFMDDKSLYTDGTLDWDVMTKQQKGYLSARINYVPNKTGDAERVDGKGRNYIKLYNRQIVKVHRLTLEVPNPSNPGWPLLSRSYSDQEMIIYKREGGIQLMPSMARAEMLRDGSAYMAANSVNYGLAIPRLPQIIKVDYTYGLEEIPLDLQDAIAMTAAIRTFENVNLMFTQGLLSYSVNGFSASFNGGLYKDVMDRYNDRIDSIVSQYRFFSITGW